MNTLKYAIKKEWYNVILLVLPFLTIPFIWEQLPAKIPIHWNLQGEVDGYSGKAFAVLFIPALSLGIYLLFLYLPKIDPKKRITIAQKPMPVLRSFIILTLLGIQGWIVFNAIGYDINQKLVFLGLSLLFIVIGNYLRTIRPNYFIGIRLPWTLEDADNWRKTHKFSSYLWVGGGVLLILLFPFFELSAYITLFTVGAVLLAIIPMGYSFYLYKQLD